MSIFLDTGFYIGLYNRNDAFHERTLEIILDLRDNKYGKIYTSHDVVDELLTYFQRQVSHKAASELAINWFVNDRKLGEILYPSVEVTDIATTLFYEQEERKPLSFTDCMIVGYCNYFDISHLVSVEGGFHNLIDVIQ